MAKVEDCPGFETFGADVKAAREAKRLARKTLAEMVGIEWRYLANIENQGAIPSLPVMIQLIKICGLPVERYFNPEIMREESEQRQRVSHKLKLCHAVQHLCQVDGRYRCIRLRPPLADQPAALQHAFAALRQVAPDADGYRCPETPGADPQPPRIPAETLGDRTRVAKQPQRERLRDRRDQFARDARFPEGRHPRGYEPGR